MIWIRCVAPVILFWLSMVPLSVFAMSYGEAMSEFGNLSLNDAYTKASIDSAWGHNKQKEQSSLLKSVVSSRKYDRLLLAEKTANEVYEKAIHYQEIAEAIAGESNFDFAHTTFIQLAKTSADMYLRVGDGYVKAKKYGKAKEIYRMIITTFTGNSYKSQVKKAEYALEDLKGSRR